MIAERAERVYATLQKKGPMEYRELRKLFTDCTNWSGRELEIVLSYAFNSGYITFAADSFTMLQAIEFGHLSCNEKKVIAAIRKEPRTIGGIFEHTTIATKTGVMQAINSLMEMGIVESSNSETPFYNIKERVTSDNKEQLPSNHQTFVAGINLARDECSIVGTISRFCNRNSGNDAVIGESHIAYLSALGRARINSAIKSLVDYGILQEITPERYRLMVASPLDTILQREETVSEETTQEAQTVEGHGAPESETEHNPVDSSREQDLQTWILSFLEFYGAMSRSAIQTAFPASDVVSVLAELIGCRKVLFENGKYMLAKSTSEEADAMVESKDIHGQNSETVECEAPKNEAESMESMNPGELVLECLRTYGPCTTSKIRDNTPLDFSQINGALMGLLQSGKAEYSAFQFYVTKESKIEATEEATEEATGPTQSQRLDVDETAEIIATAGKIAACLNERGFVDPYDLRLVTRGSALFDEALTFLQESEDDEEQIVYFPKIDKFASKSHILQEIQKGFDDKQKFAQLQMDLERAEERLVELWHESDSPLSLWEYMGMTKEEYKVWLLPKIKVRKNQ